jgi:hypothetical protein
MSDRFGRQPVARWFTAAAILALLFTALGCAAFLLGVLTDPATLPLDQRAAHDAQPMWLILANGIAVAAGFAASLLLVFRRRLAEPLMLMSLTAVAIWLVGLLLVPRLREALGTDDIAVAVVVTLITWTIYWFARHSRQRGWLR